MFAANYVMKANARFHCFGDQYGFCVSLPPANALFQWDFLCETFGSIPVTPPTPNNHTCTYVSLCPGRTAYVMDFKVSLPVKIVAAPKSNWIVVSKTIFFDSQLCYAQYRMRATVGSEFRKQ
jgi:hypothetical protein